MLDNGNPPADWQALMTACTDPDGVADLRATIEILHRAD
jgi:hypothetical protein